LKSQIPGAKDYLNPKSQASNSKNHAKGRQEPENQGRIIYSVLHKHYGIEKNI